MKQMIAYLNKLLLFLLQSSSTGNMIYMKTGALLLEIFGHYGMSMMI